MQEAQAQVTLGLKAGLNLAKVSASEPDGTNIDLNGRTTFGGGAYFQTGLSEVFALQAEALYTPRGAKGTDGDATLDLSYIDVAGTHCSWTFATLSAS